MLMRMDTFVPSGQGRPVRYMNDKWQCKLGMKSIWQAVSRLAINHHKFRKQGEVKDE